MDKDYGPSGLTILAAYHHGINVNQVLTEHMARRIDSIR